MVVNMACMLARRHTTMSKGTMWHASGTHVVHIKRMSLVLNALNWSILFN